MKTVLFNPQTKTLERQFGQVIKNMIDLMGRIYKNQVIKELNQGTVDKFEDEQVGNYAAVFQKISNRVSKKLTSRFDEDRIQEMVEPFLNKANKHSRDKFYSKISPITGIDSRQYILNEGMTYELNALLIQNVQWVEKLRNETLEFFSTNTLRAMSLGQSVDDLLKQINQIEGVRNKNAEFLARNQINTYNSITTKIRAQKAGITEAKWRTSEDDLVRPSHADRNNKTFKLNKGLFSALDGKWLIPHVDFNCRCEYIFIVPELDDD